MTPGIRNLAELAGSWSLHVDELPGDPPLQLRIAGEQLRDAVTDAPIGTITLAAGVAELVHPDGWGARLIADQNARDAAGQLVQLTGTAREQDDFFGYVLARA